MRIDIPTNPDALIKLGQAIYKKHLALGDKSPLNGIEEIAKFGPQTEAANTQNERAKQLARDAETATQARDKVLGQTGAMREGTVRYYVTSARDVLLGLNKGKEQALGDWAFEVDASTTPASKPAPTQPRA